MAGIYVHIPFCKSRCIYCDFFSTTREEDKDHYVEAMCREIRDRHHELAGACVHTIYIGGGTPSLLSAVQLQRILACIRENYALSNDAEITVEMNPEDVAGEEATLVPALFTASPELRPNRISLGVQTFDDALLKVLHRRHDSSTAIRAVRQLKDTDVKNISIDLIYGLPGQNLELWQKDLQLAFSLGVQHLSSYALSYEEGTALSRMLVEGRISEAPEELSVAMYEALCLQAKAFGFEHYEISNFALPGYASRHNSSYWQGAPYLGFGPGAHSYDGKRTRRANACDLVTYLRQGPTPLVEELSATDCYDEAVMCGLRTSRGIDLARFAERFGEQSLATLMNQAREHLQRGNLEETDGHLRLTHRALMISDAIMSDLML